MNIQEVISELEIAEDELELSRVEVAKEGAQNILYIEHRERSARISVGRAISALKILYYDTNE